MDEYPKVIGRGFFTNELVKPEIRERRKTHCAFTDLSSRDVLATIELMPIPLSGQ
jgi:hypothetical protein